MKNRKCSRTTSFISCLGETISRKLQLLALVLALFSLSSTVNAEELKMEFAKQEYADAYEVIESLHECLLNIMQNAEEMGYQGRYKAIHDTVTSSFDTALIAKVIMSRYWKDMEETQQTDFVDLFKHLSVATYASRFDGYSGESFVELSTEVLKKGRLLIKTELQRPDDTPVSLNYLMHQQEDKWLIISVIANGVNDLSLKRAEYATVIKEKGFEGLVEDVAGKISDMENPGAS